MRRLAYRTAQFRRALGARPNASDLRDARRVLNQEQWRSFHAMSPRDQSHSIETLYGLRRSGWDDHALELAALLHDAGKGYIRLHERVLYVLLARYPALLCRWASCDGSGMRGALYRSLHHAERSADLALRTGAGERAARLIRRHHEHDAGDPAAAALADADDRA